MNSAACRMESEHDAVGRHQITGGHNDGPVVSRSEGMRRALDKAHQVAPTDATVLLLGETGVGKEVLAQAIHNASPRRNRPMIRVSCAAIPTTLIESEMFGHERGAFTGASARQIGRFELADGSTLFLDEIGDMPLEVQVKLLRVLEERTIERLGSSRSLKIDVRIIAATNRELQDAVNAGSFRRDLYYRLNVFPIRIPPLRERVSDIPALAWKFIDELSPRIGRRIESISRESLLELQRYSWPGNIRELRNIIERAMIVAKGGLLTPQVPVTMRPASREAANGLSSEPDTSGYC